MNWLNLSTKKQQELFNQLSFKTGILPQAIEKDAWVTLVLRILFSSEIASHLLFKGGTSLSKAYQLIQRFSEDIDISINRNYLGFKDDLTKGEIRKLRRKSHKFVSEKLLNMVTTQLLNYPINPRLFSLKVANYKISDQDPETITLNYVSVFSELPYIQHKVVIEVGARSLFYPSEKKEITSIIDHFFLESSFSEKSFQVLTVLPEKTLLEKLILLHEEFTKPKEKIRHHRMSRHLYDIGQIMNTVYGERAFTNKELFQKIILHREKFTPIKSVNYSELQIDKLHVIPPKEFLAHYKKDYNEMQENMIYGESVNFDLLLENIKKNLQEQV